MNVTTITTNNTLTIEAADALIESLNLTEMVEDYEQNELGHVYTLESGATIVIAEGPSSEIEETSTEAADDLIESLNLTELVEDSEENELGHVYILQNGLSIAVTSPLVCFVYGIE